MGQEWERSPHLRPVPASWRRGCKSSLAAEIRKVAAAAPQPPCKYGNRSAAPLSGGADRFVDGAYASKPNDPSRRTIWPEVGPAKCVPITLIGLSQ